ncbi:amino acid adenylation domain-containing protein [Streptosporangium sp. NPDC002524]|uniref:non-ribosomal peptide synthetase n=1 Tax=Streptosporangium sp. NPDC002524 TaxID=3154537 RepID=UPI00332D8B9C
MRLFSPAQERAWLEHRIRGDAVPDGISLRLRLTGPLDEKALGSALGDLAERHEVLRWALPTRGDGPRPVVSAGALPAPRAVPVEPERLGAALAEVEGRPFDPVTGPLARVSLLELGPEEHVLVLRMHPCVADEGSVAVLAADLAELYRARAEDGSSRLSGTPRVPAEDDFPRLPAVPRAPTEDDPSRLPGTPRAPAENDLPRLSAAPRASAGGLDGSAGASAPAPGTGPEVTDGDRREFWREALRDVPPLEPATDRARPGRRSGAGGAHRFEVTVPPELGVPSRAVLAAFAVLLARCSGQERFTIGVHAPGRVSGLLGGEPNEFAGTAGPLDDLVPLPVDLSGDPDLAAFSARLDRAADGAWRHRLPLQDLAAAVAPPRDPSRGALFDVAYGVVPRPAAHEAAGLRLEPLGDREPAARRTACDLDLRLTTDTPHETGTDTGTGAETGNGNGEGAGTRTEPGTETRTGTGTGDGESDRSETGEGAGSGGRFRAILTYATDVFDHATIELMAARLTRLLAEMARSPGRPVLDLPLDDRSGQIAGPPAAVDLDSPGSTLAALIAAQAGRTPDATAVDGDDGRLTYRELDERARELAGWLAAEGVGPGSVVAICLPRSARLVTVVAGVLYAGGAFLALDPSQPAPRLEYLLSDAAATVLVSTEEILGGLPEGGGRRLDLDLRDPARTAAPSPAGPRDLAYMIYTSGSTGLPKGVLLEHSGACNLVMALAPELGIGPGVRLLQFAPPTFDAWVWEVFTTLVSGGTLCVPEAGNILVGRALSRCLSEREVNAVLLPPSVIATLPDDPLPELRVLVTGGEACTPELVERWGAGRRMVNAYGPTEATVIATLADCSAGEGVPPIGLPMAGAYALVLDAAGRVAPWGVPGELHVGGAGVARGYHRRPALTAERFVPLAGPPPTAPGELSPSASDGPSSSTPSGPPTSASASDEPSSPSPGGPPPPMSGGRLYRTGDLVRQRPDGRLDFIGRVDHQVKHRGYRIELGEIEQTLRACPGVDDAAVALEDEQLVAYVAAPASDSIPASASPPASASVSESAPGAIAPVTAKDARAWTAGRLPGYMVPGTVHVLDELPLTTAGKIDRRRLASSAARAGSRSDEPRDRLELEVLEAFRRVLDKPRMGPHDAFFESGGDSRLAVTLLGRLRGGLRRPVAARLLWERPTAAGLASALRELG